MTAEKSWTASDGAQLFCRYDDFTDPWIDPSVLLMIHSALSSAKG